ncbi:MAG: amidohydrolase family protein [Paracoccus sp. (in: a-proteobacteria)]|nr:amidohydrolase family protein [Paracoccus sp. (in: a-proteobacteria)]
MQYIDAHCHFWRLDRGDYGWLQEGGDLFAPIRRDYAPADYPGAGRMIVVQAAPTVAETDYLLGLAASDARIAGVVGWVDLADANSIGTVERLAKNPAFLGIRPMLMDIADTNWLLEAPRADMLAAVTQARFCFDALVNTRHLEVLARFAAQNPDLPIVIDHAAKPQPGPRDDWARGMRALAADGRVYCKLSGLMTELPDPQDIRTVFAQLLDWFGPDRLIWGSDWPVMTLAGDYEDWMALTQDLLSGLTAEARAAIMGGNAARFYGVSDG